MGFWSFGICGGIRFLCLLVWVIVWWLLISVGMVVC